MAQPMSGTGRERINELPGIPIGDMPKVLREAPRGTPGINPAAKTPSFDPLQSGFHLEQRGGVDTQEVRTKGVTPIGKFAVILLLFALAVLFLPKGVRGWFALIIVMGALVANPGAIQEFREWVGV